ncbi:hypothetical protein [Flavobacterium piscis]|uniref:SprB repeat-containing protein n=1 Tax=Flavobacterium piscis TaxID=1114874 RepID=A0ABU1YD22_9FLAO|nr:hypothetical protein [Flavobacterium piscis]MDR7212134.1 hypothetical protein [Flavobacterium piscis]
MKKLFLFLLLGFWQNGIGQVTTYSIKVSFSGRFYCEYNNFNWRLYNGANLIGANSGTSDTQEKTFPNVTSFNSFNFSLDANTSVEPCSSAQDECIRNTSVSSSSADLIKYPHLQLGGCDFMVGISEFKPNVTIKNLDTKTPTEICSGTQLSLAAFPAGFPDEAYHWQYSIDNQLTWIDVPLKINEKTTNNIAITNFHMEELLGVNFQNYHEKQIYFRLGYENNRNFTAPLSLKYSSCAPTINKIDYIGPICSGDNVNNVTVTFSRNLLDGEEIRYFQLRAVNPNTDIPVGTPGISLPSFTNDDPRNGLITKFDEKMTGVFSYTFKNFSGLNPNATYQVQYQAFQNNLTRGITTSPVQQNFRYEEPEPLTFKIIKADNPKCINDPVEISIAVTGGNDEYRFYVDGIEKTNPKPIKEADGYYHIKGLIPTAINNIKVMDANGCIEK